MAVSDVKKIYQDVINDVCTAVREALSEEGYDDHTLQELRTLWLSRLESSRALEPIKTSDVTESTTRTYQRITTGDTNHSTQSTGMRTTGLHSSTISAVSNFTTPNPTSTILNTGTTYIRPAVAVYGRSQNQTNIGNSTMKTSNQLDGATDEVIFGDSKKKEKVIQISFQLDGTGPPVADDDDDDDDSEAEGNDVGDELDDDEDEDGNEEGKEDPNPLCSDDDVSDDEPAELFDTDNVVVCQYDKISRTKNKWRFILKSGVMNIHGRDYVFSKANGEADW